ncbi:FmdB family zinc ribbon protein [Streptomyces sp. LPB2020-019-1HS]|uniref:FmdB family zinc ribbon protein n=1 Tax=Streptomyces sp. LPB2020-019-1HS TaxID=3409689 RepID=UPI003B67F2B0
MTTYEYSCAHCGRFVQRLPMGSAPSALDCPACGSRAGRVYSSPGLIRAPARLTTLREHEERSREEPEVIRRGSAAAPTARPAHPALARLPRSR